MEKNIEDIVAIGVDIFDNVSRVRKLTSSLSQEAVNAEMESIFNKYADFVRSYPIVTKYMTAGHFYPKVFKAWLETIKGADWSNEDNFFNSQTAYIGILLRYINPKIEPNVIASSRALEYKILRQEYDKYKSLVEEAKKKVEDDEQSRVNQHVKNLKEFLIQEISEQRE